MLNTRRLRRLMYADDIVLFSDYSFGKQIALISSEIFCKNWHISINTGKTIFTIFNNRFWKSNDFTLGDNKIEIVKAHTYLVLKCHSHVRLNLLWKRLAYKAPKAYYILRQTFNFNNGCSHRVIQKLFNILIVPMLNYGAEIWACSGSEKQEIRNFKQYICNTMQHLQKIAI